jgi:hypothetical protein
MPDTSFNRANSLHVSNLALSDSRMDAWLKMELARRHDDGYQAGASTATAALFAGMLMGAGSTALMIWLATLVL